MKVPHCSWYPTSNFGKDGVCPHVSWIVILLPIEVGSLFMGEFNATRLATDGSFFFKLALNRVNAVCQLY